jgi:hypothetical protein
VTRRVSVPPERLARWLEGFAERHGEVSAVTSPDRVSLTGSDGARAVLDVPFPPLSGDLVAHALADRDVGVLLVRRGGYAAGVFAGSRLVASKVGSSYVQGTTKAGGWSQHRYANRRANQARAAFAAAADAAAGVLLGRRLDALVRGGDRVAVDAVLADPRLEPLRPLVTGPLLAVPDPRLRVLQQTPEQFRAVSITLDP